MSSLYLIINKPLVNDFKIHTTFQGYWMQIDVHMITSVTFTVSPTDLTTILYVWMDTALVITQVNLHIGIKWVYNTKFHFSVGRIFLRKGLI